MNYLNTKANRRKLAANRYRNARYLLFERCGGEIARFARTVQKSHSYVSAYLSEAPSKRMGEKVARMIEAAFDLEQEWLDDDRSQSWDRRLREAIGGSVHPLDEEELEEELVQDHGRWLAGLSLLPESGSDLLRVGRQCQQHLEGIEEKIRLLLAQRSELLLKAAPLYEKELESYLIGQGYVVKPPSYEQGQVFRVWHMDPTNRLCLQIRIQFNFDPVLELIPIPPVSKEVIALPYIGESSEQIQFIFVPADERSAPFDVTRLLKEGEAIWLVGTDGRKQRELSERLSLEPLFTSCGSD